MGIDDVDFGDVPDNATRKDHIAERLHIAAVIDSLSREAKLDNITVSDICKCAKISRTSFYRLFQDKYDAANWYMFQVLDVGNALTGINYSWYEGNLVTLSGCLLMKYLMGSAWKSSGYHAMKETGIRKKNADLLAILRRRQIEVTDEILFQCQVFAHSESFIVRNWIVEAEPRPVEDMAAYIAGVVPPKLFSLLDVPIEPKPAEKLTWGSLTMAIS